MTAALFQPYSPTFAADPYASYQALRAQHPVYYHAPWDTWLFSRYADIKALLMDERLERTMEHVSSAEELQAYRQRHDWSAAPLHS